jgi:hypothetical protein
MPGILPQMSVEEAPNVTHITSVAGQLSKVLTKIIKLSQGTKPGYGLIFTYKWGQ